VQQRPIDGNAAIADAEEAAEFDDGDTHSTAGVGQHIDHPAQILTLGSLHFLAEDGHHGVVEGFDLGIGRGRSGRRNGRRRRGRLRFWPGPAFRRRRFGRQAGRLRGRFDRHLDGISGRYFVLGQRRWRWILLCRRFLGRRPIDDPRGVASC
jgi:hypothetical protein